MKRMTVTDFRRQWITECLEWKTIVLEMVKEGKQPTAFMVSEEHKRRAALRGEKLIDWKETEIIPDEFS